MELTDKQKTNFWNKVNKTETCWLWTGSHNGHGYGQVNLNDKPYKVHRVSWLLANNIIPNGHVIRHKCMSKICLNPDHLETGTQAQNMTDKIRDGTILRGTKQPTSKLTEQQVKEIRASDKKQKELAEIYNVHQVAISQIKLGKRWAWLN